ncbi:hypothetical protein C943_03303 [Mariniradius saccharolyticus AK6]|uniref:Uncharacterized protein n=1 Tax=Mariniradius saccharolyticus AK6 TaxID=1239962 RepID=M7YBQ1_9BACT|nr:DUF6712 family protein [Mariniradius saccharolyticus]EMS34616.1 hypothetical protein C943_03303 [Mariniradius saccharolyticus AK6]
MLFNKSNNGAEELRERTGSYYANNDFARISTDVMLAEEEMIKLVGKAVYNKALDHYKSSSYNLANPSADQAKLDKLVKLLQMPIAYKATFNYYQSNLVSHQDSGRKVSIDNENEKMAWEWMLDRDDEAQLRKVNQTTDLLINWLESEKLAEWMDSDNRRTARKLFVNSETIFQDGYPIDQSPRFFYTVLPFNKEIQQRTIKKALGAQYEHLLNYWIALQSDAGEAGSGSGSTNGGIPSAPGDATLEAILPLVQKAIPLLVMSMAVKRLALQVLPEGVVQQYKSDRAARAGSKPIELREIIDWHVKKLQDDADTHLNDIKEILRASNPEASTYQLLPNNSESNKYFRT